MARRSPSSAVYLSSGTRLRTGVILVAAVLAILAIAGISVRQIILDRDLTLTVVKRTNEARVQGFEQFVLRTIETADLATRHIESDPSVAQSQLALRHDPVLNSRVFDAIVVHRHGREPLARGAIGPRAPAIAELDALAEGATGSLLIARPIVVDDSGVLIPAIRQFEDGSGYVAVLMNPRRFTDFAQHISFGRHDLISLIGLDGITRARRTGKVESSGETVRGLVMERQLESPNGTYVGPSVLDGIPRIFSHRRLAQYGLFATSGTPLSVIESRVSGRRHFQYVAMIVGIAAVIAAALAYILASRRRIRRTVELEDANFRLREAQRIGAIGDWDYYPRTKELYWSDNMKAMYGRSWADEISSIDDVARHVSPDDAEKIALHVENVMTNGQDETWEIDAILTNGAKSSRRVRASPIIEDGTIIGIHGTDQDLSLEVQRRAFEARLTEMARLESINALASTLAHELNQPLGIAANYLGAAVKTLEGEGSRSKVMEFLGASRDQLDHLSAIISSARDLVSSGPSELEHIKLEEAIETVITLLRSLPNGRFAAYTVHISPQLNRVWSNSAQLKQILFNLAKNGLEAVPEGRAAKIHFEARIASEADTVRIDISDNGMGMDGVPDPFAALATTKQTGLGLGLSLSRTLVEAHGGTIWIEATGQRGTVVSFTFRQGR